MAKGYLMSSILKKRILELNPNNKLVKAMQKEFKADVKSKKLKDLMKYAYNQAYAYIIFFVHTII